MGLRTYHEKRHFKITPEPKGQISKSLGRNFFIQKHAARRLHFDLRLEYGGVLKSWAVPRGPSQNPLEKRLAIEVEDHPLEYGNFEGTIPKGEYGGGTVMLWDRGKWEPLDKNAKSALENGKLTFRLEGERLKGTWTLVRAHFSGDKKKNTWFLIKKKEAAETSKEDLVETETLSVATGQSMDEIGEGALLKMPRGISPQLATLVDHPPEGDDWVHEIKFDGYRILTLIKNGDVRFFSRNGKDWTEKIKKLAVQIQNLNLRNGIIDGELVALDGEGKSNFQLLQNAFRDNRSEKLVYYVFDLLQQNGRDLTPLPLLKRKALLKKLLSKSRLSRVHLSEHIVGNGKASFEHSCKMGLEGIMSKKIDSPYVSRRTTSWLKSKCVQRQEAIIVGFSDPRGLRQDFGALLLGVYNAQNKLQYVGRVGSGFSEKSLKDIRTKLKRDETKQLEIEDSSGETKKMKDFTWVKPRYVVEIKFSNRTAENLFRHPVFMGLRLDKKAEEVRFERPLHIDKTSRMEAKKKTGKFKLTNPDKVLFPPTTTKLDLANYYYEIADWVMPHLKDRPLALLRCPDGATKFCFFQKHLQSKEYVVINSVEGLIGLVQLGVLEIHGWGTHEKNLEKPDILVFDLDPDPSVKWKDIVTAAISLKEHLEQIKLESFVKTTGGKGLHVVVPIKPEQSWTEVKSFCKAFTETFCSEKPKKYLATMSKQKRIGKIFVDYLRNGRGATAIIPYSTRAKRDAPVSTPISWDELLEIKGADEFNIKNVVVRLKNLEADPWETFFKIKQSLPKY